MWNLMMFLFIGFQARSIQMIKIGISHNYNTTISSTTSTTFPSTTSTETAPFTIDLSSPSPQTEMASTPSQTFPPRRQHRATSTTTTTPPPPPTAETQSTANVTELPPSSVGPSTRDSPYYYCSCDLRVGICDLNCCCDRDCPSEVLRVFNCLRSSTPSELQTRLEDFQYTHGLPTCQLHDGWLCVFRSNTKPVKVQTISSHFDPSKYKKWPDLLEAYDIDDVPSTQSANSHYKLGQPLQLWHPESKQLTIFNLPTNYESSYCHLKQAIRHLQPTASNCLLNNLNQLQEKLGLILNLTTSHQLLGKPRDIDESEIEGLNIQVCQIVQNNNSPNRKLSCFDQTNDTQTDLIVDKIELELLHNYTNILGAKLILREADLNKSENNEIWLHYKVTFKSINETSSKPSSGPLGYLTGSPVIVSRLLPKNDTDLPQILSYFERTDSIEDYHWLPLFNRQLGSQSCQLNLHESQTLRFGINLAQQCLLNQLDAPQLQENANHTQYCETLQSEIWHKLLPHNCSNLKDVQDIFISQLGRPQMDKWLPLQLDYGKDLHNLPPVQGYYNEIQQSLSCRNIFLSVRYEFHVGLLTLFGGRAPHQQILHHARIVLGQRHDLEFDGSEQQIELPLAVSVMFYKAPAVNGGQRYLLSNYSLLITIICLHFILK